MSNITTIQTVITEHSGETRLVETPVLKAVNLYEVCSQFIEDQMLKSNPQICNGDPHERELRKLMIKICETIGYYQRRDTHGIS